ncbi:hypothetical protein, partial [Helicobacter sp. MIT 14-3879]|uniref:hypothetical protein n=1 Tax=Helicobacter sp. MIT 14-3879 TaxID=2040649 RepID=UPI000E1FA9E3
ELNELPNNKEKYNKILSYFDLSLDTLDWDKLNKTSWKLEETNDNYKKNVFEYMLVTDWKQLNSRIEMQTQFLSNESKINRYNIKAIKAVYFSVRWRTKIYSLSGGTGLYLSEWILGCSRIVKSNLEVLDKKQRND